MLQLAEVVHFVIIITVAENVILAVNVLRLFFFDEF